MVFRTWACIEVGFAVWNIWQLNRWGKVSRTEQISVPHGTLWDPQAMANMIKGQFSARKLLFLLNIGQVVVRLTDSESDLNLKGLDYVFSGNTVGGKPWMSAVQSSIPQNLFEMCKLINIRPSAVHAVDTMEYRMACYFGGMYYMPFWLLIPQKPGIRLVSMVNGAPCGCYYFSNDPSYRENEITRLYLSDPPELAVVLSDGDMWLREFLESKSVETLDLGSGLAKQAMIEGWIKS